MLDASSFIGGEDAIVDAADGDASLADDAQAVEAASPDDSGTEEGIEDAASDAPDAAPWCVPGPARFCDDFDDEPPGSLWTRTNRSNGAVAFDGLGLSPPNALRTTTSAAGGYAYLVKELEGNPPTVRCELDVHVVEVSNPGDIDVFEIVSAGGIPEYFVYFGWLDGDWRVAEFQRVDGTTTVDRFTRLTVPPPIGSWFRMTVVVTPDSATVTLNGASTTLDALASPEGTRRELRVGNTFTSGEVKSSEMLFDNVDCTF